MKPEKNLLESKKKCKKVRRFRETVHAVQYLNNENSRKRAWREKWLRSASQKWRVNSQTGRVTGLSAQWMVVDPHRSACLRTMGTRKREELVSCKGPESESTAIMDAGRPWRSAFRIWRKLFPRRILYTGKLSIKYLFLGKQCLKKCYLPHVLSQKSYWRIYSTQKRE